jgi:hypothetical protein
METDKRYNFKWDKHVDMTPTTLKKFISSPLVAGCGMVPQRTDPQSDEDIVTPVLKY